MVPARLGYPNLGLGVGLRTVHYQHILEHSPDVDWFEIISENYMDSRGRPRYVLEQIAERYPIVVHGVSLSIGSSDPLNYDYLRKLRDLARHQGSLGLGPCLLDRGRRPQHARPAADPITEQSLEHVIERVRIVQDFLERPFVLENPSTYITFADSTMPEWEFLTRMTEATGCGLLLDVNNVYVSVLQPRFRSGRVSAVDSARAGRAISPRRPHQLRDPSDRHTRRSCRQPGLGTVSPRPRFDRRRFDAPGMGCEDSRFPGRPCGGAQGARPHAAPSCPILAPTRRMNPPLLLRSTPAFLNRRLTRRSNSNDPGSAQSRSDSALDARGDHASRRRCRRPRFEHGKSGDRRCRQPGGTGCQPF